MARSTSEPLDNIDKLNLLDGFIKKNVAVIPAVERNTWQQHLDGPDFRSDGVVFKAGAQINFLLSKLDEKAVDNPEFASRLAGLRLELNRGQAR